MRSPLIIITLLCVCLFGSLSVAAPGKALQRRDDPSSSSGGGDSGSSDSGSDGGGSSTDGGDSASTGISGFPNLSYTASTAPSSATNSPATSGGQQNASPTVTGSASTSSGNETASESGQQSEASSTAVVAAAASSSDPVLPIPPTLNAVWVVSGIVLLASGIVYTFVGIKHKKIQVFLSASYTAAIGITVLIIYILTPPVSIGTQGAYLAAIILPGFFLGIISVIFKDVTEGLGCGVGGFALSMWLLTLKQGGLLQSSSAKAIFICVFTGAVFSLSFSHHTRTYGLIGATAFGGATALILGVDCLAGVGLKEFWPYIWGINNKIFPLGTTTYPLTRGMVAELAAIPIATLFGILSQIKIWQILQTKREKRAQEQAEKDRIRDQEEERRGKDLVVQTEAEKMIWEQTYSEAPRDGAGMHSDSGIGSEASASEKGSMKRWSGSGKGKGVETNVEVYEMHDLASPSNDKAMNRMTPHIVVSVAEEHEAEDAATTAQEAPPSPTHVSPEAAENWDEEAAEERPVTKQESRWIESLRGMSLKPRASAAPPVIPLPFAVPAGDEKSVRAGDDDDASSVATAATSAKRGSNRFSSSSLLESLTKNRLSFHKKQASDTSSIQAIADDHAETSSPRISRRSSMEGSHEDKATSTVGSTREEIIPTHILTGEARLSITSPTDSQYFTPKNDPELLSPPIMAGRPSSSSSNSQGSEQNSEIDGVSLPPASQSKSDVPVHVVPSRLTIDALSNESVSKTIHTYRANEWAKHIGGADVPEEDEIVYSNPPSPGIPAEAELLPGGSKDEAVVTQPTTESASRSNSNRSSLVSSNSDTAPSDAAAVAAATATAKPTWPKRSSTRQSLTAPAEAAADARAPMVRKNSQEGRASSRMSTMRSSSNSRARNGKIRQSTQPVVTSPIQEDEEANFVSPPKRTSTLPNQRDSTLLERRESMMSQTSLSRSQSQMSVHKAPITNASYNASRASLNQQGMARPSSQVSRRASNPEQMYLQHQLSSGSLRSSSNPYSPPPPIRTYSPMPVLGGPVAVPVPQMQAITHDGPVAPPDRPLHYRSHTPNADLVTQRMAAWRTGLQHDSSNRQSSAMIDVDREFGAGASAMGAQWLAQQRQAKQMEQASKQHVGWSSNGMASPPVMSPTAQADPRASALLQSQAHQDVMRRMQSKAKPK